MSKDKHTKKGKVVSKKWNITRILTSTIEVEASSDPCDLDYVEMEEEYGAAFEMADEGGNVDYESEEVDE